ncbi:hypothetical protein [Flavobacterium sp. 3HN19-14]|uniref:hypothetical protein n=1 Tax=Flavobacterium sp. 3HN19-14 TaxID=3448133 RepID=UPI003EDFAE3B
MSQLPVTLPELTDAELSTIRTSINAVKAILTPKFVNLEPEDRVRYGSINEKNKLIINKVQDYRNNMPALSNPEINWTNFTKNTTTRKNYMLVIDMLNELNELSNDRVHWLIIRYTARRARITNTPNIKQKMTAEARQVTKTNTMQ